MHLATFVVLQVFKVWDSHPQWKVFQVSTETVCKIGGREGLCKWECCRHKNTNKSGILSFKCLLSGK